VEEVSRSDMQTEELIAQLVQELALPGDADAKVLLTQWFETGQAMAGPPTPPPDPVAAVEAAGPEESALYTRTAQLQTLWLVVAGAKAEYEQAEVAGDAEAQARLLKALTVLMAVTEEEGEAIQAAVKARSN
jgi:hypothetical protein